MSFHRLIIATRKSRLALWQAEHIKERLESLHPGLAVELLPMSTRGDEVLDRSLEKVGGKGLFVKELENAIASGQADLAVHSMKDVPADLPPGFMLAAITSREDPRDAFVSNRFASLEALPARAVLGTSSLRRAAQVSERYPTLEIKLLRGNVDTRLAKRARGDVEATVLALAGLKRLGLTVGTPVPEDQMLPAVGQGAVCIECRVDDAKVIGWLASINHEPTATCVTAEHAMLAVLDGSCRTPIAGHAIFDKDGALYLRGLIAKPDGSELLATDRTGPAADAEAMGREAGEELKRRGGKGFF